ncbi:MAG: proline--tRNA ligase, partial [Methanomicrobia archaeon]|nr:proline--tRNA ligase [Methanomicrobia archaeon]
GGLIGIHGDKIGLRLPFEVSPIQIIIVPLYFTGQDLELLEKLCVDFASDLDKLGYRVKIDDNREKKPKERFSFYEMKGVPVRIEVGPRDLEQGVVTIAKRNDGKKLAVRLDEITATIPSLLQTIHQEMYTAAKAHLDHHVTDIHTLEELDVALNQKLGYAKMMWCGNQACEDAIKDRFNATARVLPFDQSPFGEICPVCQQKAHKVVVFAKAY